MSKAKLLELLVLMSRIDGALMQVKSVEQSVFDDLASITEVILDELQGE